MRAAVSHQLLSILVACVIPCTVNAQVDSTRADVIGTRVSLIPPPDYEPADRFPGFVGPNGASIQVTEMPGPVKEVTAGFTDRALAATRGMTVISSDPIALQDGTPAVWIYLRQEFQGQRFLKWIVAFGNNSATVMLIATVRDDHAAGADALFKQSLVTARWRPPSATTRVDTAGLPFSVRPVEGFEFVMRVGPLVGIALAGTSLPEKSGNPLLVVGASTQLVAESHLVASSTGLLRKVTPDLLFDKVVRSSRSLTVAGKPARELIGSARHTDGYSVAFYQVVVADGVGHIQVFGHCRLEDEPKYLPAFQQMTETLSLHQR